MINIEMTKCIGCGRCVNDCVRANIKLCKGKVIFGNDCILCGHCVAVCPMEAFTIPEFDMSDVEPYDPNRFRLDPDNLLYIIKARRSIRQYAKRKIEAEKLQRIVQAGRYTATGSNKQGCRFILVQDGLPEFKKIIWDGILTAKQQSDVSSGSMLYSLLERVDSQEQDVDYLFRNAPAALFVAAESTVDAAMAAQNMELTAIAQGLGVMYNGYLAYVSDANPVARQWLDVKEKPVQICMLAGYPSVSYERTAPRKMADVRWR